MLSEQVRNAAREIGLFYLKKNNDNYTLTEQDINHLRISKIEVSDECITITTSCPGLLIGRRGMNIDALVTHLGKKVKILEEEDPLYCYLIPYPDDEFLPG